MRFIFVSLLIMFMYSQLAADEIYLKNNNVLKGKIIQITSERVEYDPVGKMPFRTVLKQMVDKIVYSDGKVYTMTPDNISSENPEIGGSAHGFFNSLKLKVSDNGLLKSRITIWGGIHDHLYGYTDKRYVACQDNDGDCENDQGDYLKTNSKQFGLELTICNFSEQYPELKSARAGFNIAAYYHEKIKPRTLYAVPLHDIPEETVLGEDAGFKKNQKWWWNIGVFIGVDKRLYAFDFGITFLSTIVHEESRLSYGPDSSEENPTFIETEGRGLMFDELWIRPNVLLRLGVEKRPHFIISYNRLDYDPVYGSVQSKLCFPIFEYFALNTGGYLWKTQSLFLEPVIKFAGASLGYKTGVIINFHDEEFEKAGVKDSIFHSVSLSYEW